MSSKLRVAIVGGSLGGLTAALLLRDLGHDVDVFERATGELTGFGAGLVAHETTVRYFIERTSISPDRITVPVHAYRLLDGAGALLWEEPVHYRFVSWGTLYRALLGVFGRERYHQGAALVGFEQDASGVDLRFAAGPPLRYDLLVLAANPSSTRRNCRPASVIGSTTRSPTCSWPTATPSSTRFQGPTDAWTGATGYGISCGIAMPTAAPASI